MKENHSNTIASVIKTFTKQFSGIKIMIKKTIIALSLLVSFTFNSNAQTNNVWNGKKCAVVLTYDDGLNIDLKNVVPALDSFKLKGTFYISDYFNGLNAQIPGWKKAAAEGHELANHTIW